MLLGYKPLTWSVQSPSLAIDKPTFCFVSFTYIKTSLMYHVFKYMSCLVLSTMLESF